MAKAKKTARAVKGKKSPAKKAPVKKKSLNKISAKKVVAKKVTAKKANQKKTNAKSQATIIKPKASQKPKKASIDWANFLVPLDDRLIVEVQEGERVTAGGIIIPDTSKVEGNCKATVLIVGRGHRDDKGRVRPMDVRAGDEVVFSEFAGNKVDIQDRQVLILRESDVLGIFE